MLGLGPSGLPPGGSQRLNYERLDTSPIYDYSGPMSEFDYQTERCPECDGHFRHFAPCPFYTGEPALSLEQRIAVEAMVPALPEWQDDDLYIMNANEADDYMHEDAGMEAGLFGDDC